MKLIIQPQGTLAIYEQIVNQLKNAIANGICKINIYSEMLNAWNSEMLKELQNTPHLAAWPCVLRKNADAAMRAVIREKIMMFGSDSKA